MVFTDVTFFTTPIYTQSCNHALQNRQPHPLRNHTDKTDLLPSTTQHAS